MDPLEQEPLSVLLVDDDAELCSMMAEYFSQAGHRLECVNNGSDGLARALQVRYDIALLDVMLPFVNGFSVLQQLRRRKELPIIMLTARVHREDRISGLNKGADDYVTKPFDPDESLARIYAVLRRAGTLTQSAHRVRTFVGIEINRQSREVRVEGRLVELTELEFDILDMLIRSAGRIVSQRGQVFTAPPQLNFRVGWDWCYPGFSTSRYSSRCDHTAGSESVGEGIVNAICDGRREERSGPVLKRWVCLLLQNCSYLITSGNKREGIVGLSMVAPVSVGWLCVDLQCGVLADRFRLVPLTERADHAVSRSFHPRALRFGRPGCERLLAYVHEVSGIEYRPDLKRSALLQRDSP